MIPSFSKKEYDDMMKRVIYRYKKLNLFYFNYHIDIQKNTLRNLLLIKTNIKIPKIIQILNKKFGNNYKSILIKDLAYFACIQILKYYKFSQVDIIKRFNDEQQYDELIKRINIRIKLYLNNWSINTIEKFIFTKILKKKYTCSFDEQIFNIIFSNLIKILKLTFPETIQTRGRPKIPEEIKHLVKEYHNSKKYKNISDKYKLINTLQNNHLTTEEFNIIKSQLTNQIILKKLETFVK